MSEIDEKAIICPICRKNQNQKRNTNRLVIIVAIIFIIIIGFMVVQERNNTIDKVDKIRTNNSRK